jgi:2-polyprenyl-6-methoxyphenol hydroxylase-like FAD-dependent oxidoreductase
MRAHTTAHESDNDGEVIIVGAGPTGLTVASSLAARGKRTIVLDAQSAGSNTSRAAVVHSHTLEVLERLGIAERLDRRGVHVSRFTIRDRDRILVPVRFDALPTRYPYTLMISQAETERVLRERFAELGGVVRWQSRVMDARQDASGVTVTLEDGVVLRGRYLVGADGMHSRVREAAGIPFTGDSYVQSFSLADVRLSGGAPRDEVILYFSPAGLVVVAPLPDGVHRIVATTDSAPEHPDASFVQALLDARGSERQRVLVREVLWGSRFRVHHHVADAFRAGRILLAGDSAHVHSPAGGQGMNTGIQDAVMLGEALAATLDTGEEAPLRAYEEARRPIAQQVVRLADGLTRLATMRRALRPMRNALLRLLSHLPAFRNRLALRLSGLVFRPTQP